MTSELKIFVGGVNDWVGPASTASETKNRLYKSCVDLADSLQRSGKFGLPMPYLCVLWFHTKHGSAQWRKPGHCANSTSARKHMSGTNFGRARARPLGVQELARINSLGLNQPATPRAHGTVNHWLTQQCPKEMLRVWLALKSLFVPSKRGSQPSHSSSCSPPQCSAFT